MVKSYTLICLRPPSMVSWTESWFSHRSTKLVFDRFLVINPSCIHPPPPSQIPELYKHGRVLSNVRQFYLFILELASTDTVTLNPPHPPQPRAIEAFKEGKAITAARQVYDNFQPLGTSSVLPKIQLAIISSRRDWNNHEPRMWSRASGLDDAVLTSFEIENDLVEVRAGGTAYGTISKFEQHPTIPTVYNLSHCNLHLGQSLERSESLVLTIQKEKDLFTLGQCSLQKDLPSTST